MKRGKKLLEMVYYPPPNIDQEEIHNGYTY